MKSANFIRKKKKEKALKRKVSSPIAIKYSEKGLTFANGLLDYRVITCRYA